MYCLLVGHTGEQNTHTARCKRENSHPQNQLVLKSNIHLFVNADTYTQPKYFSEQQNNF